MNDDQNDGYVQKSARDEFTEYTDKELQRLHNSDVEFDEHLYRKAVELVLHKLRTARYK